MTIKGPDGKDTADWLDLRGVDSDAFRQATRSMRRRMVQYLEEKGVDSRDSDAYTDLQLDEQRKLTAILVFDWSFEEPCTPENVDALLVDAPYIGSQIDEFVSNRSRFVVV